MYQTGNYRTYEVFSQKAIERCRRVIWRGLFNATEGEGKNKRYFVYVNLKGFVRIKNNYPSMTLIETKR